MIRTGISMLALAATLALPLVAAPAAAQTRPKPAAVKEPTAAEADAFVAQAEKEFYAFNLEASRVAWINATYITDDTGRARRRLWRARHRDGGEVRARRGEIPECEGPVARHPAQARHIAQRDHAARADPRRRRRRAFEIATRIGSQYGKGKGTLKGQPISGSDIEAEMGTNRNPDELKEMWLSWHDNVGAPMRQDYARLAGIANEGAAELGFGDVGAMWRSGYDMPPADFAVLTDKLWDEVKPLYESLHRYVRMKLSQKYGAGVQPGSGPIRADLLGKHVGAGMGQYL